MIYITGDCHANFHKFSAEAFPEQKNLNKDDYVIVCGDFGGIWDGSKSENYWLDWLNDKSFTTLFVDGNHENFNMLNDIGVEYWHGGLVHKVRPSILHLCRGNSFDIDGYKVFAFGGASSHDISDGIVKAEDKETIRRLQREGRYMFRILNKTWWEAEMPSYNEYLFADSMMFIDKYKYDIIVTHSAPSSIVDIISGGLYAHDELTDYFETVKDKCEFDYWFFGHYHTNRQIWRKFIGLYEQIIELPPKKS